MDRFVTDRAALPARFVLVDVSHPGNVGAALLQQLRSAQPQLLARARGSNYPCQGVRREYL